MSLNHETSCKIDEIKKKCSSIKDGNPQQCRLQTRTDDSDPSEPYRKTFGERDSKKPHKTLLLVGERGTGKTTLINVMINYMLGVKREDKVWFEITDDQSDRTSVYSQTSRITVYGFYPQESPIHLTFIDTPGYGNTHGIDHDAEICNSLFSLSQSPEKIHEIDAVCLVIDASQNRLSDRQIYSFTSVQSLFGRDIAENTVLLLTHSPGTQPKNALTAVKEAKIKCAVNDKNEPVYFLFDNCQSEAADEEYEIIQKHSWDKSFKEMEGFFKFLDTIQPKTLRMFFYQQELKEIISSLQQCVQMIKQKQEELKETQEALKQDEECVRNNKESESKEVSCKEKADIDPAVNKMTCASSEENSLNSDNPQKDDLCQKCPDKYHCNKHEEEKTHEPVTKQEQKTCEEPKKEYDDNIRNSEALIKKLEEELHELEKEKIKHAFDAFHCVVILQMKNIDSLADIDFLIETLKELKEDEKAKILENTKQEKKNL